VFAEHAFRWTIAAVAVGTVAAMAALWPGERKDVLGEGLTAPTERATINSVTEGPCPVPQSGTCITARAELETGPDAGDTTTLSFPAGSSVPDFRVGAGIRVSKAIAPPPGTGEAVLSQADGPLYNFTDFERRAPMLWLALAFGALVILFGRARGALSLLGLAASLLIVIFFIVPAILDGEAPIEVALVGSLAVMLVTISLAHGLGPKSLAAMLGTTLSLALVAALAVAFSDLTHLTGLASEESAFLQVGGTPIDFKGLLIAGMLIGALGVLDDVTVSQASTVLALRAANASLGFGQLYRRAIDVGRDHVSATVNTLVLAYVGTSLPVLLIFGSGGLGFFDAVNVELVAQAIVGTLVGSIGLIAAVPITTALAALLARGVPLHRLGVEAAHAH
jgi:uncharacterized membrane protein